MIYAAVKLYQYSDPNSNFDMYVLDNSGNISEQNLDWNGPGNNPLIINNPSENIYFMHPTIDKEGIVDANNVTYIFSGSSSIQFTKIDADGTILVNGETIITGIDAWTNEIRTAVTEDGRIYIVWSNDMHDITCSYSDDGGTSWATPISLCYNASNQMNKPQICCDSNGNAHIIWQQWTGSSNILCYMKQNSVPMLRVVFPDDSVDFVEMTGSGVDWEGNFAASGNGTYSVRVSGSNSAGETGSDIYNFEYPGTGIEIGIEINDCSYGSIGSIRNRPNPFSSQTEIVYSLSSACEVSIRIFDVRGRLVTELTQGEQMPGIHSVNWNPNGIDSGMYFYRINAGSSIAAGKCLIISD